MIEESIGFPAGFYVGLMLLALAFAYAWSKREVGLGIPMAAVLATVSVWYFGDAIYNDYDSYIREIGLQHLESAWWQVALFIGAFLAFVPMLHRMVNRRLLSQKSEFWALMQRGGIDNQEFQRRLDVATGLIFGVWSLLMLIALVRMRGVRHKLLT